MLTNQELQNLSQLLHQVKVSENPNVLLIKIGSRMTDFLSPMKSPQLTQDRRREKNFLARRMPNPCRIQPRNTWAKDNKSCWLKRRLRTWSVTNWSNNQSWNPKTVTMSSSTSSSKATSKTASSTTRSWWHQTELSRCLTSESRTWGSLSTTKYLKSFHNCIPTISS